MGGTAPVVKHTLLLPTHPPPKLPLQSRPAHVKMPAVVRQRHPWALLERAHKSTDGGLPLPNDMFLTRLRSSGPATPPHWVVRTAAQRWGMEFRAVGTVGRQRWCPLCSGFHRPWIPGSDDSVGDIICRPIVHSLSQWRASEAMWATLWLLDAAVLWWTSPGPVWSFSWPSALVHGRLFGDPLTVLRRGGLVFMGIS